MPSFTSGIQIRSQVSSQDLKMVRTIADSSGFFRKDEIDVAVELVREALAKGDESGYYFLFADMQGETVGFACFGPIPCTIGSFDLYWIAVHQNKRGQGIGHLLLKETETAVEKLKGRKIYIETSALPKYDPTRHFYLSANYSEVARFKDFYDTGDDKVVYCKEVRGFKFKPA
jgi:GNAT superfamily N-acetyltransferase